MLSFFEVMLVFAAILAVLVLFENQRAKEVANRIAKRFCQQNGLQFLDGTVSLGAFRINKGMPLLIRQFRFEYSIDKVSRHWGSVSIIGRKIESVYVDPAHLNLSTYGEL